MPYADSRAVMHGFVSLEASEGFKLAVDLDESFRRLLDAYSTGLMSLMQKDVAAPGYSVRE